MNKLLIALPLLALLSIGGVLLMTHKSELAQEENAVTIGDWDLCYQSKHYITCDELGAGVPQQLCYWAASKTADLTWPGMDTELDACKSFYSYFEKATTDSPLIYKNYYINCFLSDATLAAAQQSDVFYNQIYKPHYITCAGY